MDQNSLSNILEAQIRECYGRVVWTHKTHEKCADLLNERDGKIKLLQIVLSAVATSGILASVAGDNKFIGIISALVSLALLILNTYMKKYDLGGLAQKHADAAAAIWNVRECYLSLLADMRCEAIDIDKARQTRDKLQSDLHKIYKGSPRTINEAYSRASRALKEMEEMTFTDKEIDKFLPKELRKLD